MFSDSPAVPKMQKLTCLTCNVNLPKADAQRDHYKSEWHTYNLKRKLNLLKSITEEEFVKTKQLHTQSNNVDADNNATHYCSVCGKNFFNLKSFNQHNLSKKHIQLSNAKPTVSPNNKPVEKILKVPQQIVKIDPEDFNESDWEEIDSDEEELEKIPLEECLFCSDLAESMEMNLSHMSRQHSFFIPDVEYCVDLKGLLTYLGIKIASGRCCLWCSEYGKQFASKKSAQQHMIDKGHSKIKFENSGETLLEYEDFYDYSSSYPEGDEDEELEPTDYTIDDSDYQLRLPSGSVVGHRSLFVYYKQNLKPQSNQVKKSKNKELLDKVMSQYKALGWTGLTTKAAIQRSKDINFMHRIQQKHSLRLGKRNNNLQPYIRCQMGFK